MKESARGKMNLYLLRHGRAAERDARRFPDDSQRPLLAKGQDRIHRLAAAFPALAVRSDRIVSSPYRRAAETMTCLQEAAGAFPMESRVDLMPDGRPAQVDLWLRGLMAEASAEEVFVLISHQPFLSDLVFHLTGRDVDAKKASCTVIKWESPGWRYERHYQPAELRG